MARSLTSVLSHLLAQAASPAAVNPLVAPIADCDADAIINQVTQSMVAAALAANPVAVITDAQKTMAKRVGNVRSLALAVLALAANKLPDVRAVAGWRMLQGCTDRKALEALIRAEMDALGESQVACGVATGYGTDAPKRGAESTILGKGPVVAPTSGQAASRLLRDVWLASAANERLDTPAQLANEMTTNAVAMKRAEKKSRAAA